MHTMGTWFWHKTGYDTAALDRGLPGWRDGAATEMVKARQLRVEALRQRSDRAGPGSGPWRFYACACGDGRTPPHSANQGTARGGLATDRWAPHVRFFPKRN
jgi:hypothetical protein